MHIPDGYLSPSTCVTLFGAAVPFWTVALRRLQTKLTTQSIPLVSVFAAFSFIVMMFNLPLPGGTTGHAVGMGVASIVLGPWVSIAAISVALLIQAIFFGDGGITAYGANCFNMAIVGSLVAYAIYRAVGYKAPLSSGRRVLAAGLAGYGGINIAAFCAAVEFGIQPLLFLDTSGAPLYAPYPLHIAIPAMMAGHLTLAGLAEFVISAGIVAYLQRSDPALLRATAPDVPATESALLTEHPATLTARKLWLALAGLLILTPLGILATGTAWGEWSAQDFGKADARRQIAISSGNVAPPSQAPLGLRHLSSVWNAPLTHYAPRFVGSVYLGYMLAALAGVLLILACAATLRRVMCSSSKRRQYSFFEKTARGLLKAAEHSLFAERMAESNGLLQRFDPRAKLAGMAFLIFAAVAVHELRVLVLIFLLATGLALCSHISVAALATRIWFPVLAFTGIIAAPAMFLIPGIAVCHLPLVGWTVSRPGIVSAVFLILRAETASTLSVLLVLTTLWSHVLKALRVFRVPVVLVVVLGMTYRYIFVFLQAAHDMFESRRSRIIGTLTGADSRRLAGATAGVLLSKSMQISSDVHMAMQARGFRGEVYLLDDLRLRLHDWLLVAGFLTIASMAVWFGR